jgi:hypothetical protein
MLVHADLMLIQMVIPLVCDDLYVEFEHFSVRRQTDAYSGWYLKIERPKIRGQMGHLPNLVEANSIGYEERSVIQI